MITDSEGVQFRQWCWPRLHLGWPSCRKLRRQVFKRINRRLRELGLQSLAAYRRYLWGCIENLSSLDMRERSPLCLRHDTRLTAARLKTDPFYLQFMALDLDCSSEEFTAQPGAAFNMLRYGTNS